MVACPQFLRTVGLGLAAQLEGGGVEQGMHGVENACSEKTLNDGEETAAFGSITESRKLNVAWRHLVDYLRTRLYMRWKHATREMPIAVWKGIVCTVLIFSDPLVQADGHTGNTVSRFACS